MGALKAPQDKHGQEHRTGTSRVEQTTEAMAELGALEAMAALGALEAMAVQGAQEAMAVQGAREAMHDRLSSGPWPRSPWPGPPQPEPFLPPPPKISLGYLGGIKSPPGLNRQDKTGTGQGQDNPQEQEALLGLSSQAEASSGHDEESGAITGSLSNHFHLYDREAGG